MPPPPLLQLLMLLQQLAQYARPASRRRGLQSLIHSSADGQLGCYSHRGDQDAVGARSLARSLTGSVDRSSPVGRSLTGAAARPRDDGAARQYTQRSTTPQPPLSRRAWLVARLMAGWLPTCELALSDHRIEMTGV